MRSAIDSEKDAMRCLTTSWKDAPIFIRPHTRNDKSWQIGHLYPILTMDRDMSTGNPRLQFRYHITLARSKIPGHTHTKKKPQHISVDPNKIIHSSFRIRTTWPRLSKPDGGRVTLTKTKCKLIHHHNERPESTLGHKFAHLPTTAPL